MSRAAPAGPDQGTTFWALMVVTTASTIVVVTLAVQGLWVVAMVVLALSLIVEFLTVQRIRGRSR